MGIIKDLPDDLIPCSSTQVFVPKIKTNFFLSLHFTAQIFFIINSYNIKLNENVYKYLELQALYYNNNYLIKYIKDLVVFDDCLGRIVPHYTRNIPIIYGCVLNKISHNLKFELWSNFNSQFDPVSTNFLNFLPVQVRNTLLFPYYVYYSFDHLFLGMLCHLCKIHNVLFTNLKLLYESTTQIISKYTCINPLE